MNYKDKALEEANGADYPLGMALKKMFVWTDASVKPVERDVLGFFRGLWLTPSAIGVCQWPHAAEIPTPKGRPFTSAEELDKAIAEHGQWLIGVHSGARYLITSYGNSSVRIDGDGYTMMSMMKDFKFLDGTPCGVKEA